MKQSNVFSLLFFALLFTFSFSIDTDLQAQPDIKGSWLAIDKDGNELGFQTTFDQIQNNVSGGLPFPSLIWNGRTGKFEGEYTGRTLQYFFRDQLSGTVVKVESTLTYNARTEILSGTASYHYDYSLLSTSNRTGTQEKEVKTYNYSYKRGSLGTPPSRI